MNQNPANTVSKRQTWRDQIMVASVIAIFFGPMAFYSLEPERLQWLAAAAVRKYEQGEQGPALEELTEIVEQSSDPKLRLRLIAWLLDAGQAEKAIGHCDVLIAKHGDKSPIGAQAKQQKADCFIVLGRPKLAMENIEQVLSLSSEEFKNSIRYRNRLSYYRALCRQDLGPAIRDMNTVIRDIDSGWFKFPTSFPGRVAMAAGLVSRVTNQRELAIKGISTRLEQLNGSMNSSRLDLKNKLYKLMHQFVPLDKSLGNEVDLARDRMDKQLNELAVLKSVLALLMDEIGQVDEAMRLRNEVARAGYDSADILESLPTEYELLPVLDEGATYLDTRGYVHFIRGEYRESLRDMNLAILASAINLESLSTSIVNTTDMIDIRAKKIRNAKTQAILFYHRMQIHDALTETELAESDRQRVIELGFKPGPNLL